MTKADAVFLSINLTDWNYEFFCLKQVSFYIFISWFFGAATIFFGLLFCAGSFTRKGKSPENIFIAIGFL